MNCFLCVSCRRVIEAEAKRQEVEAKKKREEQKRVLKKERQRLRQLADATSKACSGRTSGWDHPEDVEKLCQMLEYEALHQLCNTIGNLHHQPEAAAQLVLQELAKLNQKVEEEKAEREKQKKEAMAMLKVSNRTKDPVAL
jgi:DnaJ family protein C protein 2